MKRFDTATAAQVALVLGCMFLLAYIAAPFAIWQANGDNFTTSFTGLAAAGLDLWPIAALVAIAGLSALLPSWASKRVLALAIAAFAILLLRFNFFQDASALIGNDAEGVAGGNTSPLLAGAVYAALLVAALVFSSNFVTIGLPLVVIMTLVQTAQVAGSVLLGGGNSASSTSETAKGKASVADFFKFSGNGDTLHILLDEFQTDLFEELFETTFKGDKALLPGFVQFRDHLGLYPMTEYSLSNVMTDQIYKNDYPREKRYELFPELTDTPTAKLLASGRKVDIADGAIRWFKPHENLNGFDIPMPYHGADADPAEIARKTAADEAELLKAISRKRLFPKPVVFGKNLLGSKGPSAEFTNYLKTRHLSHTAFFRDMADRLEVVGGPARYKFTHFLTTHNPALMNEQCEYTRIQTADFETMKPQTLCMMRIMFRLFDRMRELGIYDKTNIIIFADHGRRLVDYAERYLEQRRFGKLGPKPVYSYIEGQLIASARPLLMVKKAGATEPFRQSNAPTHYTDIIPTIEAMNGLAPRPGRRTVFDIKEDEQREREFIYYHYNARGKDYQDRLIRYRVNGPGLDPKSWTRLDEDMRAPGLDFARTEITMGKADERYFEYDGWLVGSWMKRDRIYRNFAVAEGPATMEIAFKTPGAKTLTLTMKADESLLDQSVTMLLDGTEVGTLELEKPLNSFRPYEVKIPAERVGNDPAKLHKLTFKPKRQVDSWGDDPKVRRVGYGIFLATVTVADAK